jgi:hypothetical protein
MATGVDSMIDEIDCYYTNLYNLSPLPNPRNKQFLKSGINNFATRSLVLRRFLLHCVFFYLEPGSVSLHSHPFEGI